MTKLSISSFENYTGKADFKTLDCLVDKELPPLIKDGDYEMIMIGYRTEVFYGKAPKLVMSFKIIEQGESHGAVIKRYYNVLEIKGKAGRRGAFRVGLRSDFMREFSILFPEVNIRRLDRFPMSYFAGVVLKGRVKSVNQDTKQRAIPKGLRYSKVSELLEVI